jgi:hypothetical protein
MTRDLEYIDWMLARRELLVEGIEESSSKDEIEELRQYLSDLDAKLKALGATDQ